MAIVTAAPTVTVEILPEGAPPLDVEMEIRGDEIVARTGAMSLRMKLDSAGAMAVSHAFEEYAAALLEIEAAASKAERDAQHDLGGRFCD